MRERYVRPPLVADEPRDGRVAASRPLVWALTAVALAAVVVVAVVLAGRVGGAGEQPGIDRTTPPTPSTTATS